MVTTFFNGGTSGGSTIGQSAADLVSFHNATPCDQAAYVASISTTISNAAFTTTTQAVAAVTLLNAIQQLLIEKGLMAAS